jgi:hypothetical protein
MSFLALAAICMLMATYLGFAFARISNTALAEDNQWPRPWPYPDQWLLRWNDQLDAEYPAPPGTLKIHGEIPRMRFRLLVGFSAFFLAGGVCLARPVLYLWRRKQLCGEELETRTGCQSPSR